MITIGIPTLNDAARLRRCLESIASCTTLYGVRVLVCDDGSNDEQLRYNKGVIHEFRERGLPLDMLTNNERLGISKSWNRLVRHYPDADVIALANDDIEVVPHWLDVLDFSVRNNSQAGMVGLNAYVSLTKKQHAALYPYVPEHVRSPRVDYHEARLMDGDGTLLASGGSLFAFRRDAYELVGGFDERYFCFYEEVDFGVSLRVKNLFSFIADYPVVYHMGGATTSKPENMDAQARLLESRQKFVEKWGRATAVIREQVRASYVRPAMREWNTTLASQKE